MPSVPRFPWFPFVVLWFAMVSYGLVWFPVVCPVVLFPKGFLWIVVFHFFWLPFVSYGLKSCGFRWFPMD